MEHNSSNSNGISPPKVRLNSTPLRRMNTVGSSANRTERRRLSSLAALYTPENANQPLNDQNHATEDDAKPQQGYRKLSIGSKNSPTSAATTTQASDRVRKRMSGINFNIPVVAGPPEDSGIALHRKSNSSSSSPQMIISPTGASKMALDRPSSIDSIPSPSPASHFHRLSADLQIPDLYTPLTPTPSSQKATMDPTPPHEPPEDPLLVQLRELASKELDLLEIKETIKNLVNKKRAMELEFEALKKAVERSLHQQIVPQTTSKKSHSSITSPRSIRSPHKQHHRTVSDHPLDDNFNSVTATGPSSNKTNYQQDYHQQNNSGSGKKQSGLWGILSQVDTYIQSEFEKFNIIDLNPATQERPRSNLNESFYQVPNNNEMPSEENKIKKLLDGNSQNSLLPLSIRNVVDAVIYGSIEEEEEESESRSSATGGPLRPKLSKLAGDSKKSVELKDFSKQTNNDDDDDDEWDNF